MKSKIFLLTAIFILFAAFSAQAFSVEGKIIGIDHWEGSGKVFVNVERASDQEQFSKAVLVTSGDFSYTKQVLAIALTALSLNSDVLVYIQNGNINGITIVKTP